MTDPDDETTEHAIDPRPAADRLPTRDPGATDPTGSTDPAAASGATGATDATEATARDPWTPDPTTAADPATVGAAPAPRPTTMPGGPLGQPAAPPPPVPPGSAVPPASDPPPLSADPNRPADPGWREPPWIPPRPRRREGPSIFAVIVGLALIAFGLWFFVDRTLGIALPAIRWSSIWPIILIVIGGIVLIRSIDRSR